MREIKLRDKFFIQDSWSIGESTREYGEIFFVYKVPKCDFYWIQENTETDYYDWCYDCSGSIEVEELIANLKDGTYRLVDDRDGWMEI
ncbi:hypothetical protein LG307_14825 [Sutcliffiella horikoshii]|uniref:hypothetical protein n=1 Tax=Sutcliffiella horikoshii TaxID=79883 RepID=UPI00384A6DEF